MSVAALKNAVTAAAGGELLAKPASAPTTLPDMLKTWQAEITRALPRHLSADRMCRIALTCFRMTPKLALCKPLSVFSCILQASQLGLEPGVMGQAYLIPFGKECQLVPGYQGLLDLVRRAGMVQSIEAHVVYERDQFDVEFGTASRISHKPCLDGDPGAMRLVYAVARLKDGGIHTELMTKTQVETIRNRSQGYKSAKTYNKDTPWDTDAAEMWRKTVLRRICKFLPKTAELATALAIDDAASAGNQRLNFDDVLDDLPPMIDLSDAEEVETAPPA